MTSSQQTSIHFGCLGNGITVYDVSKYDKSINDYPTIAHISNEGNVTFYSRTLSHNDINIIMSESERERKYFRSEIWDKLRLEEKYQRILDASSCKMMLDIINDKISIREKVKKYENRVIFKDVNYSK